MDMSEDHGYAAVCCFATINVLVYGDEESRRNWGFFGVGPI